jgi:hypothetical protein
MTHREDARRIVCRYLFQETVLTHDDEGGR